MKRVITLTAIYFFCSLPLFSQAPNKSNSYDKFYRCVYWENRAKVQKLVDKGYDIDSRDESGKTILMYCLKNNELEFARLFIDAGADINLADNNGNTCLHYAIENCRDRSIILKLIDEGAQLDVPNKQNYTPFHFSILFACPSLPFYFIDKGVNYKQITSLNENALHLAIEAGCDTLTKYLLKQNINLYLKDNNGFTPLLAALSANQVEIASQLIDLDADINMKSQNGTSCIAYAIANQDSVNFRKMLKLGVDVKQNTKPSLLYMAADTENKTLIKELLLAGADDSMHPEDHEGHYNLGLVISVKAEMEEDESKKLKLLERSIKEFDTARTLYRISKSSLDLELLGEAFVAALLYDDSSINNYEQTQIKRDYYAQRIRICDKHLKKLRSQYSIVEYKIKKKQAESANTETIEL